jgi:hypothetical protein
MYVVLITSAPAEPLLLMTGIKQVMFSLRAQGADIKLLHLSHYMIYGNAGDRMAPPTHVESDNDQHGGQGREGDVAGHG